jgi:excisionase family DNA binding protein
MTNEKRILQELNDIKAQLKGAKEILTSDEAAAFLNLELAYLYKLTSAGILPFFKPNGKKIYFSRQDLVNWALSNRSVTSQDLDEKAATYIATHPKK